MLFEIIPASLPSSDVSNNVLLSVSDQANDFLKKVICLLVCRWSYSRGTSICKEEKAINIASSAGSEKQDDARSVLFSQAVISIIHFDFRFMERANN